MPRRSPPPDRLICEGELSAEELVVLRGMATALGIEPDKWHRTTLLGHPWGTLAVVRLVERLRDEQAIPTELARVWAADKVGMNDETIKSRLRDFARQARGPRTHLQPKTSPG